MEIQVAEALEKHRQRLASVVPEAEGILDVFRLGGFRLNRLEPSQESTGRNATQIAWMAFLVPDDAVRQRFELAPEVLLLLLPGARAQAKDLSAAERIIVRDLRLDRGLVFVVARDPEAGAELTQACQETGRTHLFLSFDDLREGRDWRCWLTDRILNELGSAQLFQAGRPVHDWDFIGRREEQERFRRILSNGRPVGLYGMRKVGKTSLLLRVKRGLLSEALTRLNDHREWIGTLPIHLDMLKLSPAEQDAAGFWRQFTLAVFDAASEAQLGPRALGVPEPLWRRAALERQDGETLKRTAVRFIEGLMTWAKERPGQRQVLFILDEYERLFGIDGSFKLTDGLAAAAWLRGITQSHPGRFTVVFAGVNRLLLNQPRLGGQSNPVHGFFVDFPLAGFAREEAGELLRKIGRRLSLDFVHDAVDAIMQETGGHPYLLREYGDVLDKATPLTERAPAARITRAKAVLKQDAFRRRVVHTMREFDHVLTQIDATLPFALAYLHANPEESHEVADELGEGVMEEMEALGIVSRGERPGAWNLRLGCLGAWLVRNYAATPSSLALAGAGT